VAAPSVRRRTEGLRARSYSETVGDIALPESPMDKTNPPTTFGVFKPVGHTLMAFSTDDALQAARAALAEKGFGPARMVEYTPQEMLAQVDAELKDSSPLANFGYELDLVRLHKAFAEDGCSFLVVETKDDTSAAVVADLVRAVHPVTAQRYGRFMIEDLTEKLPGRQLDKNALPSGSL
jgi:hypothetical protein